MRCITRVAMSTPAQTVPSDLYGMFVGQLDPDALHRFTNSIDLISKRMPAGLKRVHLAFHCNGGGTGEGIALYNLFRAVPVELVLYNIANVASIGVIAFLGAKIRRVSLRGAFEARRRGTGSA